MRYIQIYGERNSGTNYLHFLLENNIKNVKVGYKYGWKHGFAKIEDIKADLKPEDLVICLFKDPYSWIVSMHGKPHHAPQMLGKSFSDFIRAEWACYQGDNYDTRDLEKNPLLAAEEMMYERDPETGDRFENIIKLRSGKIKRLLELKNHVPNNVAYLKYEEFLQRPRINVCDVAGVYKMRLNGPVKLSKGYFGKNPSKSWDRQNYYLNKEYLKAYSAEDLSYVNNQLDWEQERQLGYEKIETL